MKEVVNKIRTIRFQLLLFPLVFLFGCNLEENTTVKLPNYESQLVVECYLEPGFKVQLLLTESSGYFAEPKLPLVNDAVVTITYLGIVDTLKYSSLTYLSDFKYYNYVSSRTVPIDYENEFELNIEDGKGRKVTSKTYLIPPPTIDSLSINFNNSSKANLIAHFVHNPDEKDYYRILFHKDSVNNIIQNITFSDEFSNNEKIVIGTRYDYIEGDEAFVTLYKLNKDYYDFLQSIDAARSSNGNPFSQPSLIKSNVVGGIGIFTGLSFDFKNRVIERKE